MVRADSSRRLPSPRSVGHGLPVTVPPGVTCRLKNHLVVAGADGYEARAISWPDRPGVDELRCRCGDNAVRQLQGRLLRSAPHLNADRRAEETEALAQLIHQEPLVREMERRR